MSSLMERNIDKKQKILYNSYRKKKRGNKMRWINKIKNLWRRLFKKGPSEEEVLEQFLKIISPLKIVKTYKNAIVIQNAIDGDWGDIWDFSLWETKGVIGWTIIDHWEPGEKHEKPVIMITDVYEYGDGSYGVDVENRIDLGFQDGYWLII